MLEPPRRGGSNNHHNQCFGIKCKEKYESQYTLILRYKIVVQWRIRGVDMFSKCITFPKATVVPYN